MSGLAYQHNRCRQTKSPASVPAIALAVVCAKASLSYSRARQAGTCAVLALSGASVYCRPHLLGWPRDIALGVGWCDFPRLNQLGSCLSAPRRDRRGALRTQGDIQQRDGGGDRAHAGRAGYGSNRNPDAPRGHSTSLLAKHLGSRNIAIHSFDRDRRGDAIYAEDKLAGLPNLHLHYGDSRIAVPRLIGELANQRVALLIDGPKDKKALDLLSNCIAMDSTVVIAFVHDLPGLGERRTPSEGRRYATEYFERPVFTDDEAFVARFRDLDTSVFADPDQIRVGDRSRRKAKAKPATGRPSAFSFRPTADREAAKRRQGSAGRLLGSYYWAFKDWLRGIGSPRRLTSPTNDGSRTRRAIPLSANIPEATPPVWSSATIRRDSLPRPLPSSACRGST